jgi:hypothetical protein
VLEGALGRMAIREAGGAMSCADLPSCASWCSLQGNAGAKMENALLAVGYKGTGPIKGALMT